MKPIALELEILRKGRHEDVIDLTADPKDAVALQAALRGWLRGHGWDEGHWGKFEAIAREPGRWKRLAKVRAV